MNAKGEKQVIYGSILNAQAVANYIDKLKENVTLLAAGEIDYKQRQPYLQGKEWLMVEKNKIFAAEDFIAAGAISYFSRMNKTESCLIAENWFKEAKTHLINEITKTASHKINESRGKGNDTLESCYLNLFDVIPKLHFVGDIPEINRN
jgi:phosphosulfolactate phosphohydrolase-like enzyme